MQFKRILGIAFVLSLSFVLAACGGGATATPAAETEAVSTDGGEATEAAEAGDGEEAGSADLSESASATDAMGGTVTVSYPAGWTPTAMDGTGTISLMGAEAGQAVTVTFLNSTVASALGDSPSAVLTAQSDALAGAMPDAEIGDVTEVEIGGNPAAVRTITVAGVETRYYIVSTEGGYAFVYGSGVDAATVEAIAATVSYSN